jgi:hypothetical protein
MKKRLSFLLLFGLFIATSCEKEQTPVVENVGLPLIVKEIYSDEVYNEFIYNEQNLLKERKSKWFYTLYHYNANNQLSSYDMYEDPGIYSSNWAVSQAAMNRKDWVTPQNTEISGRAILKYQGEYLKSITVTRAHSDIQNVTEFTYDSNGRIVNQIYSGSDELVQGRKVYTYDDNGNVILEDQYYSSVLVCSKSFEYDDKHNPFKVFNRPGIPGIYTNENNIVKETLVLMENAPGVDSVQVTESTYEYNDQGYPVTKDGVIRYEYK